MSNPWISVMATTLVAVGGMAVYLAAAAKKKGIVVNTVAMMEPKANEPMANLAKRTGGAFTIFGSDGKARPGGNTKSTGKAKK